MKKLVLLLAVAFSVSMFSCGNGDDKAKNDTTDSAANKEAQDQKAPVQDEKVPEAPVAPVDTNTVK